MNDCTYVAVRQINGDQIVLTMVGKCDFNEAQRILADEMPWLMYDGLAILTEEQFNSLHKEEITIDNPHWFLDVDDA